jgi:hypothetical protein
VGAGSVGADGASVVVDVVVTVELVVGSVVDDDVLLVAGANDVEVLLVVVSTTVEGGSVVGAGVVDGALASAPLQADNSITAASSACVDVALRPVMRRRSYGPPPSPLVDPGLLTTFFVNGTMVTCVTSW